MTERLVVTQQRGHLHSARKRHHTHTDKSLNVLCDGSSTETVHNVLSCIYSRWCYFSVVQRTLAIHFWIF